MVGIEVEVQQRNAQVLSGNRVVAFAVIPVVAVVAGAQTGSGLHVVTVPPVRLCLGELRIQVDGANSRELRNFGDQGRWDRRCQRIHQPETARRYAEIRQRTRDRLLKFRRLGFARDNPRFPFRRRVDLSSIEGGEALEAHVAQRCPEVLLQVDDDRYRKSKLCGIGHLRRDLRTWKRGHTSLLWRGTARAADAQLWFDDPRVAPDDAVLLVHATDDAEPVGWKWRRQAHFAHGGVLRRGQWSCALLPGERRARGR